ncbi:MAG: ATP-binding protein [Chromatiaceae bacterium]|nr:MAG: ATP-binding protein [Chromatiaceae bacterium]
MPATLQAKAPEPETLQEVTLVIENRLSELARVERWLAETVAAWSIPERAAFALDLVMNEAVTNVVNHAYRDTGVREIRILLRHTDDWVEIEVSDDGEAFDPFAVPVVAAPTDLEQASIGGRGIHLIKAFTDDRDYRRVAGRNHLRLRIETSDPSGDA